MRRSRVAIVVALALLAFGLVLSASAAHAAHAAHAVRAFPVLPAAHTAADAHAGPSRATRTHPSDAALAPIVAARVHKLKRRVVWLSAGARGRHLGPLRRDHYLGELGRASLLPHASIRRYDAPANAPPVSGVVRTARAPRGRRS